MLLPDPDGPTRDPLLPRPMAVFRGGPDALEFRFKVVGPGTALLSELREGEALGVLGPLGNGFSIPDRAATLVGGGTGIASLYELAREAPAGTRVLLGGRSRRELLALEEFRALPVEVEFSTDDGSLGHTDPFGESLHGDSPLQTSGLDVCSQRLQSSARIERAYLNCHIRPPIPYKLPYMAFSISVVALQWLVSGTPGTLSGETLVRNL